MRTNDVTIKTKQVKAHFRRAVGNAQVNIAGDNLLGVDRGRP